MTPDMLKRQTALAFDHGTTAAALCADRADRAAPGWIDRAVAAVSRFAEHQTCMFTIEMVRSVVGSEIDPPTDLRAWGHVTRRAVREKLIERVPKTFSPAASSNGSPKPMYRRGKAFTHGLATAPTHSPTAS